MRRTALLIGLMLVSIPAFALNRSRVRAGIARDAAMRILQEGR